MPLEAKSFDSPEETRPFRDKGQMEVVHLNGDAVGRGTFEPGWRWSEHIKPIAGTESCHVRHVGDVESGRMKVVMDDGEEVELGPGEVFDIPPDHDAWTVGDEPCVLIDFGGLGGYAQS